jgi:hypothetical protein
MDPNACLAEIIKLAKQILNDLTADNAYTLADRIESLDVWLSKGGFLPERWER